MPDTRLVRSCFSGQGHRMRCGMRTCCSSGALLRPPSPALLRFRHPSAHAPIDSDKRFLIPCLSCTQLDYVPAFASAEGLDDRWDRVRANSTATPRSTRPPHPRRARSSHQSSRTPRRLEATASYHPAGRRPSNPGSEYGGDSHRSPNEAIQFDLDLWDSIPAPPSARPASALSSARHHYSCDSPRSASMASMSAASLPSLRDLPTRSVGSFRSNAAESVSGASTTRSVARFSAPLGARTPRESDPRST